MKRNDSHSAVRVNELEALDTRVLADGMLSSIPHHILDRLWAAVGRGEAPNAYTLELPARAVDPAHVIVPVSTPIHDHDMRGTPPPLTPIVSRVTVAIVDDDSLMLDVMSRMLKHENFELLTSSNGQELLDAVDANSHPIDVLVTDLMMPGMQGGELAGRLRERLPDVKVLYETGFSDALFDDRLELEAGAAFVEKPFTTRGLREAIRLLLFDALNPPTAAPAVR